jgi:hypothetical protein
MLKRPAAATILARVELFDAKKRVTPSILIVTRRQSLYTNAFDAKVTWRSLYLLK